MVSMRTADIGIDEDRSVTDVLTIPPFSIRISGFKYFGVRYRPKTWAPHDVLRVQLKLTDKIYEDTDNLIILHNWNGIARNSS